MVSLEFREFRRRSELSRTGKSPKFIPSETMGWHLTARLAWHDEGRNGHVCAAPQKNTYCVGAHSYPGNMIAERRDLAWEKSYAGNACAALNKVPPCVYSINAFGTQALSRLLIYPHSSTKEAKRRQWVLPPATVCVWPYKEMYRDEVRRGNQ